MIVVYSYFVLDILHYGHLRHMKNGKALAGENGRLIAGILTDEAVMERKPKPILPFHERVELARAIRHVDLVVPQTEYSPVENIRRIVPDILIESSSHSNEDIALARTEMSKIGGRVIVLPYSPGQSSTQIRRAIARLAQNTSDPSRD